MSRIQKSTSSLRHLISFKGKRNNIDNECETEEHIYESVDRNYKSPFNKLKLADKSEKPTMIVKTEFKRPLTKPFKKINKDDIQVATDEVKLNPVKPIGKISKTDIKIATEAKSLIKNNNDDILAVTKGVKLKPAKISKADIQVATNSVNNVKLTPIHQNKKINKDEIQIATNGVKLNTAKPMVKINKPDIQVANAHSNGVNQPVHIYENINIDVVKTANPSKAITKINKDQNQRTNNGIKLNPTKPLVKTSKPDILLASDVKLKPVKTMVKVNKADIQIASNANLTPDSVVDNKTKPPVSPKPNRLNINPAVMIVKQGLSSTTNEMLNKGRLQNVGRRNV